MPKIHQANEPDHPARAAFGRAVYQGRLSGQASIDAQRLIDAYDYAPNPIERALVLHVIEQQLRRDMPDLVPQVARETPRLAA